MQIKIFAAAVAALSFASVQGAILPRATITPGVIVLPSIVFNPNDFAVQEAVFRTLDLLRGDIAKTAALVDQLTTTTSNSLLEKLSQANLVIAQTAINIANIVTKFTQLATGLQSLIPALPTTPSNPPVNVTDIGDVAEDVVRQAQVLARAITAQLERLRSQATGLLGLVMVPTLAAADAGFKTVLATIGTVANLALTTAASATTNVQAVLDRVRNAQIKLDVVLKIGTQPDVVFD